MDINKTIIMTDKVSGKSREAVVNEVISDVAWGVEVEGTWRLVWREPQTMRPMATIGGKDVISYAEFLEKILPGSANKKRRMQTSAMFTSAGQPGDAYAKHAERLAKELKNPDGSDVHVITSFFELMKHLKQEGRSFTVCFRTFGEDMESVLDELNLFCEGRHPRFPGVYLDGSDGFPDYRVFNKDPTKCGTFHREEECTSLVMGTWEQPGEGKHKNASDKSLAFYKSELPHTKMFVGLDATHDYLQQILAWPGTLCLRDYHQYWKKKGQTSAGGKMFFVERDHLLTCKQHQVFFDDNIRYEDAYIIQPILWSNPSHTPWVPPLLRTNLCRAIPWESIGDQQWFVKQVQRMETAFEHKLVAKQRVKKLLNVMRTSRYKLAEIQLDRESSLCKMSSGAGSGYDPWKGMRHTDKELSTRAFGESESHA